MSLTLEEAKDRYLGEIRRDFSVDGPTQNDSGEWRIQFGKKAKDGSWMPTEVLFADEAIAQEFAKELRRRIIDLQVKVTIVKTSE